MYFLSMLGGRGMAKLFRGNIALRYTRYGRSFRDEGHRTTRVEIRREEMRGLPKIQ